MRWSSPSASRTACATSSRSRAPCSSGLLPSESPLVPGFQLDGICHPAAEVGGDYFDFLRLRDGNIGIVVADVSGKGASASLYMAEIKGMMLSLSSLYPSPREALIELNRHLYPSLERRVFASMLYGVLDRDRRRVVYARAGHPPLLRIGADGGCESYAPGGMAVGIDAGELFDKNLEEAELELSDGDTIVMYTDGITDAMNDRQGVVRNPAHGRGSARGGRARGGATVRDRRGA